MAGFFYYVKLKKICIFGEMHLDNQFFSFSWHTAAKDQIQDANQKQMR